MIRQSLKTIVAVVCLSSTLMVMSGCGQKEDAPPAVPAAAPTPQQTTFESQAAQGREADAKKRMAALKQQGQ